MMRTRKWGFFPFDAMDYKAAQAYLDKKADAGWVLDRLSCRRFARFVPAGGRVHAVDLNLSRFDRDQEPEQDYLQLCADAGWEITALVRGMLVFRSKPGARPVPLQTDEAFETDRFWKKYVRKKGLTLLVVLLLLAAFCLLLFSLPNRTPTVSTLLCINAALFLPPVLALCAVYLLWSLFSTAGAYIRSRRLGRLPRRGRPGAWLMGVLELILTLLLVGGWCLSWAEGFGLGKTVDVAWSSFSQEYTAAPELCQSYRVVTAADLGLEPSADSRYLDGRCSLLVDRLDYSEIADGAAGAVHILTTERYDCASEALARRMFALRRTETAEGRFTWGALDWGETASAWGFDQVCTARDGSYLLLREGRTVALIGAAGFDLTEPEHLETIRQRVLSQENLS